MAFLVVAPHSECVEEWSHRLPHHQKWFLLIEKARELTIRRCTRLTNALRKKTRNHEAMLGVYFAWYNWCRMYATLKTTPAVKAGLALRTMDAGAIAHRRRDGVRLGSKPNNPGGKLGFSRFTEALK